MRWFKHDSDAHRDAKLLKVIRKYGMEGYGLYWHCIELIVSDLSVDKMTFELEHDAELISGDTGIHAERVQEMMTFMVDLGLFENSGGIITCLKIAKRLDQSMSSNMNVRKIIDKIRSSHDSVMIESEQIRREEKRREEKRKDIHPAMDTDLGSRNTTTSLNGSAPKKNSGAAPASKSAETWNLYAGAYRHRYGVDPVRNAKVNRQLCTLVDRVGAEAAPHVAGFYVASNRALYVQASHCVDLLLRDAEALHTAWRTGRHTTETQARQEDRRANTAQVFQDLLQEEGNGEPT